MIRMTTDALKLMRLQSWLSPAFPIGAYSYSHGLERAVEAGEVRDRATLVDWLEADLRYGAGRSDGIFFAESWRAVKVVPPEAQQLQRLICKALPSVEQFDFAGESVSPGEYASAWPRAFLAIAVLAAAVRATSELALESAQQGIAFLTAVRKAWPHPELERLATEFQQARIAPMLPIAASVACAVHQIALETALPLYLHAGVANLINAAVRLIPLGQTDGQMALAALETPAAETAAEALKSSLAEIGSAAFMIDIASMQHETQYTRLFRS